jgi:ABC-type branched-subunit amino acid transport system ATPase component
LLGSNGAGNTTLVRSILGPAPPCAGRIVVNGIGMTRLPTHRIVAGGIACIPEGREAKRYPCRRRLLRPARPPFYQLLSA